MTLTPISDTVALRAKKIRLLLLDVDGVLTDGKLYYFDNGEEAKAFSTLDGQGIKLLQRSGVEVGIITGRKSGVVAARAKNLGISLLVQGREDKYVALQEVLKDHPESDSLEMENIAFMGDDYPDLTVMCRAGLALTVANAHPDVAQRAHWQSQYCGGNGAVRDACDMIMKAQGHYQALLDSYTLQR